MLLDNQPRVVSLRRCSAFDRSAAITSLNLIEPIMHHTRNSPTHRQKNLLCDDLRRGTQSVDCTLMGYPTCSPPLELSSFEEHVTSLPISSPLTPAMALERNLRTFNTLSQTVSEHYTNLLPMCAQNQPGFSGYCPVVDSGFTTAVYDPIFSYRPLDSLDFGGMYSEPIAAHQPPTPPAAPEQSILPNASPFSYHPCRWLSGPQCDGSAPGKNREMGEHLRVSHGFVGHERDQVQCQWEDCGQFMQRMNVPRHIVSRHLLAAATCRYCGRQFSRPDVVCRHEKTCSKSSPISSSPVSRV